MSRGRRTVGSADEKRRPRKCLHILAEHRRKEREDLSERDILFPKPIRSFREPSDCTKEFFKIKNQLFAIQFDVRNYKVDEVAFSAFDTENELYVSWYYAILSTLCA